MTPDVNRITVVLCQSVSQSLALSAPSLCQSVSQSLSVPSLCQSLSLCLSLPLSPSLSASLPALSLPLSVYLPLCFSASLCLCLSPSLCPLFAPLSVPLSALYLPLSAPPVPLFFFVSPRLLPAFSSLPLSPPLSICLSLIETTLVAEHILSTYRSLWVESCELNYPFSERKMRAKGPVCHKHMRYVWLYLRDY